MSAPSSRMPVTSMSATSSFPRKPERTNAPTCDRWMSRYSMSPALIFFRQIGSDWYGSRSSTPSTIASAPSSSGAVDAPVQTLTRNFSPLRFASMICFARATGTTFG